MRILLLSTSTPRKDGKGYEIILYHRIKFLLLKGETVDLFVSTLSEPYMEGVAELKSLSTSFNVKIYKILKTELIKNIVNTLFLKSQPLQVGIYKNSELSHELSYLLDENRFDIVISNLIRPLDNLPKVLRQKLVLDAVDSMALNYSRRVPKTKLFKKVIIKLEHRRLKKYEKNLKKSIIVLTVAKLDLNFFSVDEKYCIDLGVDETKLIATNSGVIDNYVFSGNMKYEPNINAYDYLCSDIWPEIKKINPDAKLYVVGRESDRLRSIHSSIYLVGSVRDMKEFLAQMDISIAPMRLGSGMQFKILEALSVGLPVLTTKLSLGSINAEVGKDVFLFAEIGDIKQELKNINAVGNRCQKRKDFIKKQHSWESANNKFYSLISRYVDVEKAAL